MNELGLILLGAAARATALAVVGLIGLTIFRRTGAATAALVGSTTLAVMVAVSALALAPWPHWWALGDGQSPRPTVARPTAAASTGAIEVARSGVTRPAPTTRDPGEFWADFVAEFRRELAQPTSPATRGAPPWRWPAWVACVFLGGLTIVSARLAFGLRAVRSLRSGGRPVDDSGLLDLLATLGRELGLDRAVALRETGAIATPATVGWRRPVVLLPLGWREWDATERRAILAHELAHVLRGDYLAGLLAQASLALHFYHPLAHILARRVRLDQELAADACGAHLAGGRRPYLTTLANLALRQDPRPAAWPARPFLPHRGTFLRRIEMLRDPKILESRPMPPHGRAALIVALATVGLLVAGLRGPAGAGRALAQQPSLTITQPPPPPAAMPAAPTLPLLDPLTASSDAHLAIDIRPLELLKNREVERLAGQFAEELPEEWAAIVSGGIEQILILGFDQHPLGATGASTLPQLTFVFRSSEPHGWKAHITPKVEPTTRDGITYLKSISFCYRVLDERTLLVGTEADMISPPIGVDRPRSRHNWNDAWKQLAAGPVRLAFDTPWLIRQLKTERAALDPMARLIAPLWEKTRAYGLTIDVSNGLSLNVLATAGNDADAARVAATVRAVLTLGRNSLPDLRQKVEQGPVEQARVLVDVLDALDGMLGTARVEQDKSVSILYAQADAAIFAAAARIIPSVVGASREAARRAMSINNVKQIGLAMHNYHEKHGAFPPAILYGPDGKTPYSWRVALLPYLALDSLFQEYKFDEPWDGPNNSKLLARMPAVYRDPAAGDVDSSLASYFVPTGEATMFPDRKEGMKFAQLTDGSSNTIMAVEAKRAIPWTKPEDIAVHSDGPLPPFGGYHPGGFNALFADGSVRFISSTIDRTVLHNLFTPAGGEVIEAPPR